jgi:putative copper export protein/mono/diheme cytochrome c family protein
MSGQVLLFATVRWLHVAGLLSLFGTLAFIALVAPPVLHDRLTRMARLSAAWALLFGVAWFLVQASAIAGTTGWDELVAAIPAVALDSRFGQVLAIRLLLVLAVVPLTAIPRYGRMLALVPAAIALGSQGLVGHAGAAGGPAALGLITSEALHLLAAGAWLGALLPLLICLRALPPHAARVACEQFSPVGLAAVLVISGTAFVQAVALIGGLPRFLGTPYGLAALGKLLLFLLMLGFAMWNRLSLTDRLDCSNPEPARRRLLLSVTTETGLGLMVMLMAALMASLPPGMHAAPSWPFPWRPSLAAMGDTALRQDVALALIAIGAGVAATALSWVARRGRVVVLLLAIALISWQVPALGLLLVPAYPTSYLTSPTGFSVTSIASGQSLFAAHCAACHGAGGLGDGPAAKRSRIRPADVTAEHLWDHSDGELFWWLSHGIDDPSGGQSMPGFAAVSSDEDRWAMIDFIRARNAGAAMLASHGWTHPVPAPDMPLICSDGTTDSLAELRGQFVRVIAGADTAAGRLAHIDGVVTLRLDRAAGRPPRDGECVSATATAWPAYAAVAGIPPDSLQGTEFLVDSNGWLRDLRCSNELSDWNDPKALQAIVRTLREQPITAPLGGMHVHGQ